MKKKDIFLGQLVYTTKNSAWGTKAMKVCYIYDDYVTCKHTLGLGAFPFNELEPVTEKRTIQIKKYLRLKQDMEDNLKKLEKKLFGNRNEI